MTNAELNRDIKRLFRLYTVLCETTDSDSFFAWVERYGRNEFLRLYNGDMELKYMNKRSILIMIKMNRHLTIIPHHQFFIGAKIE